MSAGLVQALLVWLVLLPMSLAGFWISLQAWLISSGRATAPRPRILARLLRWDEEAK